MSSNSSLFRCLTFFVLAMALLAGCRSGRSAPPTLFLIGDSTAAPKQEDRRPETGWGERLAEYFVEGVRIENHARNGRSSLSFRNEGLWEAVYEQITPGDYVFIQFGHNDPKPGAARFSSPEAYGENLQRYVRETRARGGRPVILSPVVRRKFDGTGQLQPTHGAYPEAARRAAEAMKVPFIDMTALSREVVSRAGDEPSKSLFLWLEPGEYPNYPDGLQDNTHFSPEGARAMAGLVVRGVKDQKLPLARYLRTGTPGRLP